MNRVPCTSQWRCSFLLLPPCLIWVIQVGSPDCFASLVWTNCTRTRCSGAFWMMRAKLTKESMMLCLHFKWFSRLCYRKDVYLRQITQPGHSHSSVCLVCEDVVIIRKPALFVPVWMWSSLVYGFLWVRLQTGGLETVTSTNSHSHNPPSLRLFQHPPAFLPSYQAVKCPGSLRFTLFFTPFSSPFGCNTPETFFTTVDSMHYN